MHRNCVTNILNYLKCAHFKTYFYILTHSCISLNDIFVIKHLLNYKIKPVVTEMKRPTHFCESVLLNSSLQTGSETFLYVTHVSHTTVYYVYVRFYNKRRVFIIFPCVPVHFVAAIKSYIYILVVGRYRR